MTELLKNAVEHLNKAKEQAVSVQDFDTAAKMRDAADVLRGSGNHKPVEMLAAKVWAHCFDRGDLTAAQANNLMAALFEPKVIAACKAIIHSQIHGG